MVLTAQIMQALNATVAGNGTTPINIQFGTYGTFSSFFGLADLPAVNPDLYGVADYASAMIFELFTNTSTAITTATYPSTDDIYVRFLFHNGTASNISEPVEYPLFGTGQAAMGWNQFQTSMNKVAVGTMEQWCTTCGNTTGTCAAYVSTSTSSGSNSSSSGTASATTTKSGNGLSPAVNGVIGAMVTLAVVLGAEALIMLLGGLRLVSKKSGAATSVNGNGAAKA